MPISMCWSLDTLAHGEVKPSVVFKPRWEAGFLISVHWMPLIHLKKLPKQQYAASQPSKLLPWKADISVTCPFLGARSMGLWAGTCPKLGRDVPASKSARTRGFLSRGLETSDITSNSRYCSWQMCLAMIRKLESPSFFMPLSWDKLPTLSVWSFAQVVWSFSGRRSHRMSLKIFWPLSLHVQWRVDHNVDGAALIFFVRWWNPIELHEFWSSLNADCRYCEMKLGLNALLQPGLPRDSVFTTAGMLPGFSWLQPAECFWIRNGSFKHFQTKAFLHVRPKRDRCAQETAIRTPWKRCRELSRDCKRKSVGCCFWWAYEGHKLLGACKPALLCKNSRQR